MVAVVPAAVSTGPGLPPPGDTPRRAHEPVTPTVYKAQDARVARAPDVVVVGEATVGVGTEG